MDTSQTRVSKAILFLVTPQIDFIGLESELPESGPSSLHVGPEVVSRLRGNGQVGGDPLVDIADAWLSCDEKDTFLVTDEDWHPDNWWEFSVFHGKHCVKGTVGARLPERLERKRWEDNFHYIRANSINIGVDPLYAETLKKVIGSTPRSKIKVLVAGVYTNIKVDYLLMNLLTTQPAFPYSNIAVCEYLCGAADRRDHEAAIRKFKELNLKSIGSTSELEKWLELQPGSLNPKSSGCDSLD